MGSDTSMIANCAVVSSMTYRIPSSRLADHVISRVGRKSAIIANDSRVLVIPAIDSI